MEKKKVCLIFANSNVEFTKSILDKTIDLLSDSNNIDIEFHRVPGCFEIPVALYNLHENKKYTVFCIIGAFVTFGETIYMEMAKNIQRDIQQFSNSTKIPVINGLIVVEEKSKLPTLINAYHEKLALSIIQMLEFFENIGEGIKIEFSKDN